VADRHGQVEKDPKPQVLFTQFGDNNLSFELRYWVHVLRHNSAQIASDLRHMINSAFREKGIVIAYPQRDVHLTTEKPIAVQVVSPHQDGKPAASPIDKGTAATTENPGVPAHAEPGSRREKDGDS
jgi:small-conductance mechanosensitive channel